MTKPCKTAVPQAKRKRNKYADCYCHKKSMQLVRVILMSICTIVVCRSLLAAGI